jgi:hypothetical protein
MLCIRSCHSTMYVYIYIDMVGWLKRLMAVATVPGHNLHRQISGSAPKTSSQTLPASFWWSVKRKPDQKEQNPMTASQKPPAHTASPLFQKNQGGVRHGFIHRHRPQGTRLHEPPGQRHHQSLQWESQQALS